VAIATWFINYTIETRPGSSASFAAKLLAGAQAAFTVGRFSGTFFMHYVKPRKVFLVYLSLVVVFLAAASGARGNAGVCEFWSTLDMKGHTADVNNSDALFDSLLRVHLLPNGKSSSRKIVTLPCCLPNNHCQIVALGIRGLGRHYKRGSGFIVGGVIGGGCVPALTGKVADMHNNTGIAMVVPLAFMLAALTYPICVNFLPRYKIPADALGSSDIGVSGDDLEHKGVDGDEEAQAAKTIDGAQVLQVEKR
jgi:MFS transporter, FHS family, L-fucose permease